MAPEPELAATIRRRRRRRRWWPLPAAVASAQSTSLPSIVAASLLVLLVGGAGSGGNSPYGMSYAEARPAPTIRARAGATRDRRRSALAAPAAPREAASVVGAHHDDNNVKQESYARLDTRPPPPSATSAGLSLAATTFGADGSVARPSPTSPGAPLQTSSPSAVSALAHETQQHAALPYRRAPAPSPLTDAAAPSDSSPPSTTTTFSPIIVAETQLPLLLTQNADGTWSRSTDGWLIYGRASSDSVFAGGSYVSNNGTNDGNQDGSGDMVTYSGTNSAAGGGATATSTSPAYQVTDVLPKGWGSTSDRSTLYAVPLIVVASVVLACMITGVVVFIIIARAKAKRKALRRKRHEERRRLREEAKALQLGGGGGGGTVSHDRLLNGSADGNAARSTRSRADSSGRRATGGGGGGGGSSLLMLRRRRRHTGATVGSAGTGNVAVGGGRRSTSSSLLSLQDEDKAIEQEVDEHLGGRANLGNLGGLFRELHAASRRETGATPPITFIENIDPSATAPLQRSASRRSLRRDDTASGLIGVRPRIDGWRSTLRRRTKGGRTADATRGDDETRSSTAGTGDAAPPSTDLESSSTTADAENAVPSTSDNTGRVAEDTPQPSAFPPAYNRPASIRRPDSPGANSINRDYYDPQLPSFPESAAAAAAAAAGSSSSAAAAAASNSAAAVSARAAEKRPEQVFYPAPASADQEEAQAIAYGRQPLQEAVGSSGIHSEGGVSPPPPPTAVGAHIATDDKHVLERLRVAASQPAWAANHSVTEMDGEGPSAPVLDVDDDGFERLEVDGTVDQVIPDAPTSSALPAPPKPLVYTSLPISGTSEPTSSVPEHDAALYLLASAPEGPVTSAATSVAVGLASAPTFDEIEEAPVGDHRVTQEAASAPPMPADDEDGEQHSRT